jgi:hypothetical protein
MEYRSDLVCGWNSEDGGRGLTLKLMNHLISVLGYVLSTALEWATKPTLLAREDFVTRGQNSRWQELCFDWAICRGVCDSFSKNWAWCKKALKFIASFTYRKGGKILQVHCFRTIFSIKFDEKSLEKRELTRGIDCTNFCCCESSLSKVITSVDLQVEIKQNTVSWKAEHHRLLPSF